MLVAVLALLGGLLLVDVGGSRAEAARCERFTAEAQARRADAPVVDGRRIVVIGDSWSAGLGLDDPDDAWTSRIPGRAHVDAFSGSGFSRFASPCDGAAFGDRAARAVAGGADLVLVEGGLNDVDQPLRSVRAGFAAVMRALDGAPVVVVGPASAPARAHGVERVDALLERLAEAHGATYVSTLGLTLSYLDDGLHLTAEGHRDFGDFVASEMGRGPG